MPEFAATSGGYQNLWRRALVKPERDAAARKLAERILADYTRYEKVSKITGVPKALIATLHMRESDRNFHAHLHNGDPLTAKTYHVPAGRPKAGSPPFDWEESAIDALTMAPHSMNMINKWTGARVLYEAEKYNGFGYIKLKENSPYVWSWTTEQQIGKYTSDGHFDRSSYDTQPGVAAILKEIAVLDPSTKLLMETPQTKAPPEVVKDQTKRERKGTGGAVAGTVAAGGEKTTTDATIPVKHPVHAYGEWIVIGLLIVGVIVGAVLLSRRAAFIKAKWEGATS